MALASTSPGDVVAVQVDGSGTSPELVRLRDAGLDVVEVPVYEWRMPDDHRPALRLVEAIVGGRVHAVTFTTGPAVRNCVAIAAEHDLDELLLTALTDGSVVVGCVGPVCADAAYAVGLTPEQVVVPAAWRLGPLVRAVADRLVERTVRVRMDGSDVSVAGTVAIVDGAEVELTDTEARVLATLAEAPNVVVTKADLLRRVWGDEDADPHIVEVAIGRLRRRLGPAGSAITAVHRRGYALRT
jgi:uroporphyrinogen-III synthase